MCDKNESNSSECGSDSEDPTLLYSGYTVRNIFLKCYNKNVASDNASSNKSNQETDNKQSEAITSLSATVADDVPQVTKTVVLDDDVTEINPNHAYFTRSKKKTRQRTTAMKRVSEVVLSSDDEENTNLKVTIKILWKSITIKKYELQRHDKFSKIFNLLEQEENIPQSSIFLKFRGVELKPEDSPKNLNLQIYDFIEGGVINYNKEVTPKNEESGIMTLKFQESTTKHHIKMSIRPNDKFLILYHEYSKKQNHSVNSFFFSYEGKQICENDTPAKLDLESGDVVDVCFK